MSVWRRSSLVIPRSRSTTNRVSSSGSGWIAGISTPLPWSKIPENAIKIAHRDLNVGFLKDPSVWVDRPAFRKGAPDSLVSSTSGLGAPIDPVIDHGTIELSPDQIDVSPKAGLIRRQCLTAFVQDLDQLLVGSCQMRGCSGRPEDRSRPPNGRRPQAQPALKSQRAAGPNPRPVRDHAPRNKSHSPANPKPSRSAATPPPPTTPPAPSPPHIRDRGRADARVDG